MGKIVIAFAQAKPLLPAEEIEAQEPIVIVREEERPAFSIHRSRIGSRQPLRAWAVTRPSMKAPRFRSFRSAAVYTGFRAMLARILPQS